MSAAARPSGGAAHPASTPPSPPASVDALLAEARAATGLSDFGAPTFLEGLQRLLQGLAEDGVFTEAGIAQVLAVVRRRLANRLRIEAWYRDHPAVAAQGIDGPVSITGLPRTGTTALANMMSLDPQFRCLRLWEQQQPCPPPTLAGEAQDPRRLAAVREVEALSREHPEMLAMHLFDVDATVEDLELIGLEFKAQQFIQPLVGYHRWWRDADMRPTYAYHRRVAQLLQSQRPPSRWLFKAPHHAFHLEDFVAAYPDTRFVMTHRDPARAVPSYISFVTALFPPGTRFDPVAFGRHTAEHLRLCMDRAMAARERLGEQRFFDVTQRAIDRAPLETLQRIYDHLGLVLTPPVREAVRRWQGANHAGAYGTHRYTAEQYGLSAAQLRSDFDAYIRHFDVPIED